MQSEYNDVKRSLIGHDNFLLCEHFSEYYADPAVWSMKTTEEQVSHFLKFLKDMTLRCSTVPVKPKTGKLVHATIIWIRLYLLQQGTKNEANEEGQMLKDHDPVLI